MGRLYAVTATAAPKRSDGWKSSIQVPTFYLNADVQGIVGVEHAERIARSIFAPFIREGDELFVYALCVS